MSHHARPSRGLQDPTATRRHLTGSRLKAAELLSSLGQDDLVRPELRNDVLLAGERPRTPPEPDVDRTATGEGAECQRLRCPLPYEERLATACQKAREHRTEGRLDDLFGDGDA